jgi:DNA repair exonuclease SbcCD ATPase subunit
LKLTFCQNSKQFFEGLGHHTSHISHRTFAHFLICISVGFEFGILLLTVQPYSFAIMNGADEVTVLRNALEQMNRQMLTLQETVNAQSRAFQDAQQRDRQQLESTQQMLTQTLQQLAQSQQVALQALQELEMNLIK